jgi:hypothetical protein
VNIQGDTVPLAVVHPGVPHNRHEVALLQLQGAGHIVQREDDAPGSVGWQLVYVHDAQVGAPPALDSRGHSLVVDLPL